MTLLSDFGLQDASVAIAKGILLRHIPGAELVDISHLIEPYNIQQAAYLLLSTYKHFPAGTCHVVLYDVFSERHPRLLLCERDGQYLLAPDNGILPLAFGRDLPVWQCYELASPGMSDEWMEQAGRIAAQLQTHTPAVLNLPSCSVKVGPQQWQPRINGDTVECHVIHIDRYENVVVNLTREQWETHSAGRPFRIEWVRGDEVITSVSSHWGDVKQSGVLCRFNSSGFLEICVNHGKAASLFGLRLYSDKHLMYNSIKVYFGA